jgi:hypothetical protein
MKPVQHEIQANFEASLAGRTGLLTLADGAATTTLTHPMIRFNAPVVLVPTTANAAAEIGAGTMYQSETSRNNGSLVVTHANNAQTDRIFRYFIG